MPQEHQVRLAGILALFLVVAMGLIWHWVRRTRTRPVQPTLDEEDAESRTPALPPAVVSAIPPVVSPEVPIVSPPAAIVPAPAEPASPQLCDGCGREIEDDLLDHEYWEQTRTALGWLRAWRKKAAPMERGRLVYADRGFCSSCAQLVNHLQSERRRQKQAAAVRFQLQQDAEDYQWKRVGLLTALRQILESEEERYAAHQDELERARTRRRVLNGEARLGPAACPDPARTST